MQVLFTKNFLKITEGVAMCDQEFLKCLMKFGNCQKFFTMMSLFQRSQQYVLTTETVNCSKLALWEHSCLPPLRLEFESWPDQK